MRNPLLICLTCTMWCVSARAGETVVDMSGENFLINGQLTYSDILACPPTMHGLLFNVRAVNATFDDIDGSLPAGMLDDPGDRAGNNFAGYGPWDPDANTDRFVAALPSWRARGVLAVTLNFQGGCSCTRHGTQGVIWAGDNQTPNNNPFGAAGTPIDPDYLARMKRCIDALDASGMVCILGLFYFGQDQRISNANDSQAIKDAVDAVVDWVIANDWRNVVIEVNNETTVGGYQHAILAPNRVHELFQRVKQRGSRPDGTRLFVSASSTGVALPPDTWMAEADFFLPHGNGLNASQITSLTNLHRNHPAWQAKPRPICFNEDSTSIDNLNAAAAAHASWGFYNDNDIQSVWPANWTIWSVSDLAFFNRVVELVGLNVGNDRIWIPAATYEPKAFTGAMTTGVQYTSDTSTPPDADPSGDSLVGQCVFADTDVDNGNDWVEYTVTIPATGQWYAWGRFYYPGAPGSDDPNSFHFRVDGGGEQIFGNNASGDRSFRQWHWDGDPSPGEPKALNLGEITAGDHVIRIRAREADSEIGPRLDMILLTNDGTCTPADNQTCGAPDPGPHVEVGGMVVVEAEHYTQTHPDISGNRAWYVQDGEPTGPAPDPDPFHPGASGNSYVECLPDTRVTSDDPFATGSFYDGDPNGASLVYPILFQTAGTYRVWVRVQSTGSEDNGMHVGVDGGVSASGLRIQWCGGGWRWSNAQRNSGGTACGVNGTIWIDIPTPGVHNVIFYQREDGAEFDRFILTADTGYNPSNLGIGPTESLRAYPELSVSPVEVTRTVGVGEPVTGNLLAVRNTQSGTLTWTLSETADWLTISPTEGASSGEADSLTMTYDIDSSMAGAYSTVVTITSPEAYNSPLSIPVTFVVETSPADFDGDGDVDLGDFGHLQSCFTGAGVVTTSPDCENASLDSDGDVDLTDFLMWKACLSGADLQVDPQCGR